MPFFHTRLHIVTFILVAIATSVAFLALQQPTYTPQMTDYGPNPFNLVSKSPLTGSLEEIGFFNFPVWEASFDDGAIFELVQGATHEDKITFVVTPTGAGVSQGAPLCNAITSGKRWFAYEYSDRAASYERSHAGQGPINNQFLPNNFITSPEQRADGNVISNYEVAHNVTFRDSCDVMLKENARYVFVFNDPNVTFAARGIEWCGDATIQPPEECDDGNDTDEDGCSDQCLIELCGDSILQIGLGEECDDGNEESGDGCSDQCLIEEPASSSSSSSQSSSSSPSSSSSSTSSSTSSSSPPANSSSSSSSGIFCGNGILEPLGPDGIDQIPNGNSDDEECDDGNQINTDSCDNICRLPPLPLPPGSASSSSVSSVASSSFSSAPASSSSSSFSSAPPSSSSSSSSSSPPQEGSINIDAAWLIANGPSPYYLDQAGQIYMLQTDVTTQGTAFAIIANGITFDLNGHTITYDNAAPIAIANHSFEQGTGTQATGWNFSDAANTERHAGLYYSNQIYDGSYALRFGPSTVNRSVVSNTTVTLQPNTTYSLSGMFQRKNLTDVSLYAELVNIADGMTYRTEYSGANNRGIQFHESVFTTPSTGGTYTLKVGVVGAFTTGYAYIDDIKVQRTKTYGVALSTFSWVPAEYPDITRFGSASDAIIENGTILQGADKATWGHGFYVRQANRTRLSNVDVTVAGPNASAVKWYSGTDGVIENSDFISNVQTITKRDANDGAVVMSFRGIFRGNTIAGGPSVGLYLHDGQANEVYNNTISLKAQYTNAYAIFARGPGTRVYDNVINCYQGQENCRGIFARGTVGSRYVYSNTVRVQGLPNNQEYGGESPDGNYGIQVENGSNSEIYDNYVYINAEQTEGFAFRANGITSGINVYGNTLEVNSNGKYGAAFKFEGQTTAGLSIHDNIVITNNGLFGYMESSDIVALRTNITIANPVQNSRLFEGGYEAAPDFHTTVQLLDSTYANSATRNAIEAATFIYYASGNPENRAAFNVAWTTTFLVKNTADQPVANATVTVKDIFNTTVFTGTTNAQGIVLATLKQFSTQGAVKTNFNPHTVDVIGVGGTAQFSFTANQEQTIILQLIP